MANRSGQQLGNYRLTRLLGSGGFAEVYLAEHLRLSTLAAIKILHTHMADEDIQNFQREAQMIANLEHAHIIRILDFDVQKGLPFLVMACAPNGPLHKQHPRGTPLPIPTVISYVQQIASALQHAHDQRLIHRDLKPENLLLGRSNEILLSDFGIATMAHNTSTLSVQTIAGTTPYMAPEQVQGKPMPATDQYALGIIVYEWLCGTRPFTGTATEIAIQHIVAAPPPLRTYNPNISPQLEQVVLTALNKDPKQRFANVIAFANALTQTAQAAPGPTSPLNSGPLAVPSHPSHTIANTPPFQQPSNQPANTGPHPATRPQTPASISPTSPYNQPANTPFLFPNTGEKDRAYEDLRKKMQDEIGQYKRSSTIVIRIDDDQVGQEVHLLGEETWIKYSDARRHTLSQAAFIKYYSNYSVATALFKDLRNNDYVIWTDINRPVLVTIDKGEALVVDLRAQPMPLPIPQSPEEREQAYQTLYKKMQEELGSSARSRTIIIRANDHQVGQKVHLIPEEAWIKNSNERRHTLSQAVFIKYHPKYAIATAIFRNLRVDDYVIWTDINKPILVTINQGEVLLVDLQA